MWFGAWSGSIGPAVGRYVGRADTADKDAAEIATRNGLLQFATAQFRDRAPNTWAYLDGGNAGWIDADVMAGRLHDAGLANVHGFTLNVSNYYRTSQSAAYGVAVTGGAKPPTGRLTPPRGCRGPAGRTWRACSRPPR
jgi:hypothetical protein